MLELPSRDQILTIRRTGEVIVHRCFIRGVRSDTVYIGVPCNEDLHLSGRYLEVILKALPFEEVPKETPITCLFCLTAPLYED